MRLLRDRKVTLICAQEAAIFNFLSIGAGFFSFRGQKKKSKIAELLLPLSHSATSMSSPNSTDKGDSCVCQLKGFCAAGLRQFFEAQLVADQSNPETGKVLEI